MKLARLLTYLPLMAIVMLLGGAAAFWGSEETEDYFVALWLELRRRVEGSGGHEA